MSVRFGVSISDLLTAAGMFWAGNASDCFVTTDHFGEDDEHLMAALGYYPYTVGAHDESHVHRLQSASNNTRKSKRKKGAVPELQGPGGD
jgi:hypothetical protein